jgi:hypothetical protein
MLLPDDMLADILARLAPRGLAVARAVCRSWRAAVDSRRLLRADLLPLSLAGIFINFKSHPHPEYFSRPSTGPRVSAQMDEYLPAVARDLTTLSAHCNGLLLLDIEAPGDHVVNPAMRAWAPVPPPPALGDDVPDIFRYQSYLVFDPTLSPYYEVISVPHVKYVREQDRREFSPPAAAEAEWPPSRCSLRVFSSRTNRWEERPFVREGQAGATILDMRAEFLEIPYSTYSKGALYALCPASFVMRYRYIHSLASPLY